MSYNFIIRKSLRAHSNARNISIRIARSSYIFMECPGKTLPSNRNRTHPVFRSVAYRLLTIWHPNIQTLRSFHYFLWMLMAVVVVIIQTWNLHQTSDRRLIDIGDGFASIGMGAHNISCSKYINCELSAFHFPPLRIITKKIPQFIAAQFAAKSAAIKSPR